MRYYVYESREGRKVCVAISDDYAEAMNVCSRMSAEGRFVRVSCVAPSLAELATGR
jgi:hypothetical protein